MNHAFQESGMKGLTMELERQRERQGKGEDVELSKRERNLRALVRALIPSNRNRALNIVFTYSLGRN